AIRGWLTIEEVDTTQLLFFSHTDYRLRRQAAPAGQTLKPHETRLLAGVFERGDRGLVSDLREKFYRPPQGIQSDLYRTLSTDAGLFSGRPDNTRTAYLLLGGTIGIGGFYAIAVLRPIGAGAIMLSGLIVALAARAMPRRTRKGREVYEQIV